MSAHVDDNLHIHHRHHRQAQLPHFDSRLLRHKIEACLDSNGDCGYVMVGMWFVCGGSEVSENSVFVVMIEVEKCEEDDCWRRCWLSWSL